MSVKIICVVGTRPEAIKMAPVILALRQTPWAHVRVLATAQHREMLDDALSVFDIVPDIDLDIMRPRQSLPELTARLLTALDRVMADEAPDVVLAQGDTTTVLATAMASFYRRIPFCHVEAGLRTHDFSNPFPEEMNRVLAGHLARLHFAPTEQAKSNLRKEGVAAERIFVTGNTVIDALLSVAAKNAELDIEVPMGKRLVLLTAHRRENFGAPLDEIFDAVLTLAKRHPELHFVYPVHPNPRVAEPAKNRFENVSGVTLCSPLGYAQMVTLMKHSWLILTDSGGLQEEAPALGKPVLVLRDETERPEAVEAGVAQLVGHDPERIVAWVEKLLSNEAAYRAMATGVSPYGDGHAAQRIVDILGRVFL
ncbi:UDP-N-acetylglucosamine 2-epimerase (non-hydrolyzing) [Polaromonas sp. P1-6]|nr:UDP-N-acetylglucosamine 2-epimerase (non-hydrolyzing) [Polaromonas sp. P1-6]